MVAIPEVEYHINSELSTSPSPTSRRVGVPPPKSRAGVAIPNQRRVARERTVHIFDSQPLSSPPPSRAGSVSNSLNGSVTAAASLHTQIQKLSLSKSIGATLPPQEGLVKKGPFVESPNSSPESPASATASIPPVGSTESTPPTSLGSHGAAGAIVSRMSALTSAKEQLKLKAEEHEDAEKRGELRGSPMRISPNPSPPKDEPSSSSQAPHGPSLLSQTAPRRIPSPTRDFLNSSVPSTPHQIHFEPPISVKIADLGNATPSAKHFTEDIQTRQYRAPEAIIGRKDWGTRADIWSVACVIFELLTAEYLFDPQGQGQLFTKDDDHMAQIIELMGDFSLDAKMNGKYSRELFDHAGSLRYIKSLKPWPLKRVMVEKYLYSEKDALSLCSFLEPMLALDQNHRKEARDMVNHPWLEIGEDEWLGDW